MEITDKDVKRFAVVLLIVVLTILVVFLLKPIVLSILGGLLLAYILLPVYKWTLKGVKSKNISAAIICLITFLIISVTLYFTVPLLIKQVFNLFEYSQKLELPKYVKLFFPTASEEFVVQLTVSLTSIISKISSAVLNSLIDFLLEIPKIAFHFVIVLFVFFFALRDHEKLISFVADLSPLNKTQEEKLVKQFKDITNSIVYGQVLIGLIQGTLAGIGFLLFGIPNAIILTLLAVMFSIIPILGPFFVWIPIAFYLFNSADTLTAVAFLAYNLILVSNIDNILRIYIVSKKAQLSQVIVLIGMIGGLLIFGILGLLLGPLLLAYFVLVLEAYRKNELSSLFRHEG